MPRFQVTIQGGIIEIDEAEDEDDAREQALDQVELEVVEIEEDDDGTPQT